MKLGDKIEWSSKNLNHLRNDTCAYAGMSGIVDEIFEDGGFVIKGAQGTLIVPSNDYRKKRRKFVWIVLNGECIKYRFKKYQVWHRTHGNTYFSDVEWKDVSFIHYCWLWLLGYEVRTV